MDVLSSIWNNSILKKPYFTSFRDRKY